jgi:hypothetical protein
MAATAITAGAALLGAGTGLYSATQGSSGATGKHPFVQVKAEHASGNPNANNYFGGTKSWTEGEGQNTRFFQEQELSPALEALAESMLGRAGASRGTYDSGSMPDYLKDRSAQVGWEQSQRPEDRASIADSRRTGDTAGNPLMPSDLSAFMPAEATYDRPEYGFGQTGDAIQYAEGQEAGFSSAPGSIDRSMTDLQTLDLFNKESLLGGFDEDGADWLREFFGQNPSGQYVSSKNFDQGKFDAGNQLTDENTDRIEAFRALVEQYAQKSAPSAQQVPQAGAPNPDGFDPEALQSLISAIG